MKTRNTLACLVLALFISGLAQAGERLGDDELKEFFSGNTIHGEHFKRGMSHTYFDPDGSVTSKSEDGTMRSGKWWVEDGKRCIRWDHKAKDFCHYIERDDDGSYALVHANKGKRLVEIKSRSRGKDL